MAKLWKKGRGKLGPFQPLHGTWTAEAQSPMGPVRCRRAIEPILGGHFLKLTARWEFGPKESGRAYEEVAVIGVGDAGEVCFWSFTSDGKRSQGVAANVTDLHPEAVGFEADLPAGRARMAYWPQEAGGFRWVVEARTKKGWSRLADHNCRSTWPATESGGRRITLSAVLKQPSAFLPMAMSPPLSFSCSYLQRCRSWHCSRSRGYRGFQDRRSRCWRCKSAPRSPHLPPCSFSVFGLRRRP